MFFKDLTKKEKSRCQTKMQYGDSFFFGRCFRCPSCSSDHHCIWYCFQTLHPFMSLSTPQERRRRALSKELSFRHFRVSIIVTDYASFRSTLDLTSFFFLFNADIKNGNIVIHPSVQSSAPNGCTVRRVTTAVFFHARIDIALIPGRESCSLILLPLFLFFCFCFLFVVASRSSSMISIGECIWGV